MRSTMSTAISASHSNSFRVTQDVTGGLIKIIRAEMTKLIQDTRQVDRVKEKVGSGRKWMR